MSNTKGVWPPFSQNALLTNLVRENFYALVIKYKEGVRSREMRYRGALLLEKTPCDAAAATDAMRWSISEFLRPLTNVSLRSELLEGWGD